MKEKEFIDIINFALYICAQDGIISETESDKIHELINKEYKFTRKKFDSLIDDFFSSEDFLEDHIGRLSNDVQKKLALKISKESASSDGLDIRENIAFCKAEVILGNL